MLKLPHALCVDPVTLGAAIVNILQLLSGFHLTVTLGVKPIPNSQSGSVQKPRGLHPQCIRDLVNVLVGYVLLPRLDPADIRVMHVRHLGQLLLRKLHLQSLFSDGFPQ
jgi:hypothetical protein